MKLKIDNVSPGDLAQLRALNQDAVPQVNRLTLEQLEWFAQVAAYFRVVKTNQVCAGFLIALTPAVDYNSPYFNWFCQRYTDFLYIDRVVVAAWARSQGLGKALYQDVEAFAAQSSWLLATDVYSNPPNALSLAFHRNYGFQDIGEQRVETEAKTVVKFIKTPDHQKEELL